MNIELRNAGYSGFIEIAGVHYRGAIPVGTKIKFEGERKRYTVRASNRFFSICTKPQNLVRRRGKSATVTPTVMYTIIDWHNRIKGTENLIFGMGAETDQQCEEMLERLTRGDSEISYRNRAWLNIEGYTLP